MLLKYTKDKFQKELFNLPENEALEGLEQLTTVENASPLPPEALRLFGKVDYGADSPESVYAEALAILKLPEVLWVDVNPASTQITIITDLTLTDIHRKLREAKEG